MVGLTHLTSKSDIKPISDGVIISKEMTSDFENHYISVTFFSDEKGVGVVSKSLMSGSLKIEATVNGVEYGAVQVGESSEGVLQLGVEGELVGELTGAYLNAMVSLSVTDPAGATHTQVTINNYKGG